MAARLGIALLRASALLPYPLMYRIAGWIGAAGARLPSKPARFAAVTIRTCFPAMPPYERLALLRTSLAQSARTVGELGAVWTWPRDRVLRLIREVCDEPLLNAARAQGRGLVLLTPHLGAWELFGAYCATRHPTTALFKPSPNAVLDRFIERGRARFGASVLPATPRGLRGVARALQAGEAVFFMPDQEPRDGAGVFAPFFGVQAATTTLVWRLARRFGAAVVLGWAERLPGAAGFRVHFKPISPLAYDADVKVATAALNLEIERLIRERPAQYLWSYKRFRIRPPGEANPYRPVPHAKAAAS